MSLRLEKFNNFSWYLGIWSRTLETFWQVRNISSDLMLLMIWEVSRFFGVGSLLPNLKSVSYGKVVTAQCSSFSDFVSILILSSISLGTFVSFLEETVVLVSCVICGSDDVFSRLPCSRLLKNSGDC